MLNKFEFVRTAYREYLFELFFIGEMAYSILAAPLGTKLFAEVPVLSKKVVPPSVETYVLLDKKAATITRPFFDISNEKHPPVAAATEVIAASPSFHFFNPELVAIQT